MWDVLLVTLAGASAEARAGRVSVMLGGARDDVAEARQYVAWLLQHGFAGDEEAAWQRTEEETRTFVRERWATIERVAQALLDCGRLEAAEVAAIVR